MNKKLISIISIFIFIVGMSILTFRLYGYNSEKKVTNISAALVKITPEDVVKQSDGIAIGMVKDLKVTKEPSNLRPGKQDIITNATISVENYLFNPKNLSASEITVKTIGGTLNNETMTVEESPSFEKGQRVVVFLKHENDNIFTVYGWAQGKFSVGSDNILGNEKERVLFRNIFGKEMTLEEFNKQMQSSFSINN